MKPFTFQAPPNILFEAGAWVHTVANCGHAPALIAADQIEVVTRFLNGDESGVR
jgi:hypothetical protein